MRDDCLTLEELLYALLLPSGNDAAMAIAIWGGEQLINVFIKNKYSHSYKNKKNN